MSGQTKDALKERFSEQTKEALKEHIKDNLVNFFIIVTLVNLVIFLTGTILAPDQKITYTAFLVPLLDGFLGILPGLFMYSKRELTVRQMLLREGIQLLSIEVIILLFTFGLSGIKQENLVKFLAVSISVAVIYVLVTVIRYFLDFRSARKMTEELKAFQQSAGAR